MPETPRKTPFQCPHCGFVQHEPPHLISTYCRSCGEHYEVVAAAPPAAKPRAGLVEISVKRLISRPPRTIHCHHCGHDHEVSGYAKSTICPGCYASIELIDLVFSSSVSRPVDTRGKLTIRSSGSLNSTLAICGEAVIEGRLNGTLICEGTVHLACEGKIAHGLTARTLVITRQAQVDLLQLVKATDLVVHGRARGNFSCTGRVTISKRGVLEGRLTARSVVVERGGCLLADSAIQPVHQPETTGVRESSPPQLNPLPAC